MTIRRPGEPPPARGSLQRAPDEGFPWTRALCRALASLGSRRARRETGLHLIEGPRLVAEALKAGAASFVLVKDEAGLVRWRAASAVTVLMIPERDFDRIATVDACQGVMAAGPLLARDSLVRILEEHRRILWLDGVQDPGNAGALARAALGFGVTALLIGEGTADPDGPKVLRASAGALFHLKLAEAPSSDAVLAASRGHALILPVAHGGMPCESLPRKGPWILVAGSEGGGSRVDDPRALRVTIPLDGRMESLNVSMALAVILSRLAAERD